MAKNFDQIDADKNGTVTLDEIYASAKKIAKEMEEHDKAKFEAADKDHDGTLDRRGSQGLPAHLEELRRDRCGQGRHGLSGGDQGLRESSTRRTAKADAQKN